jgi:hypothetical protein
MAQVGSEYSADDKALKRRKGERAASELQTVRAFPGSIIAIIIQPTDWMSYCSDTRQRRTNIGCRILVCFEHMGIIMGFRTYQF